MVIVFLALSAIRTWSECFITPQIWHNDLIFPQPGNRLVASAKAAVPTVADQSSSMQLGQCAKNLACCLVDLRVAAQKVCVHSSAKPDIIC